MGYSTYPICVDCGMDMPPKKNGVAVIRYNNAGPTMVQYGDMHYCWECVHRVVVNLSEPVYPVDEKFAGELSRAEANQYTVRIGRSNEPRSML